MQLATVTIQPTGIMFTAEESKVLQGNCFLQKVLFYNIAVIDAVCAERLGLLVGTL